VYLVISGCWRQGNGFQGWTLHRVECLARVTQILVYIRSSCLVISKSTEQKFWKANSCLASQEILRLLCHPNVHNNFHKSPHCFWVRHWYLVWDFTKPQITLWRLLKLVVWVGSPPGVLVSTATSFYYFMSLDHDLTYQGLHAVDFWSQDQIWALKWLYCTPRDLCKQGCPTGSDMST
jgi:hypothetical protein